MKGPWWEDLLINWGPIVVICTAYSSYVALAGRRMKRAQARHEQHMDRVENLLERIAVGLERYSS